MALKKNVLFCCGTGVATSTLVNSAVTEAMKQRGIEINSNQCKATEVRSMLTGVDLVVSTTQIPKDLGVPAITTLAFLTNIGKAEVLDKIEAALRA